MLNLPHTLQHRPPDRVDARDCRISFEKVTDIDCLISLNRECHDGSSQ